MKRNRRIKTIIFFVFLLLFIVQISAAIAGTDKNAHTSVSISSGGGSCPVVLCMWVQDDTLHLEDGDPEHLIPGCQLLPEICFEGTKNVEYYAILYDKEDSGNLRRVSEDVFLPYNEYSDGESLYSLNLKNLGHSTDEQNLFCMAYDSGLIKFGSDFDYDETFHRLRTGTADLWYGEEEIPYCLPAGNYSVKVIGIDSYSNPSENLTDEFIYTPVAAIDLDFNAINYGETLLSINKWTTGNSVFIMDDGLPTVRNIGNVPVKIKIIQDDMGFGCSSKGDWNVLYDIRIGNDGTVVDYVPYEEIIISDILQLCHSESVDFSIHIIAGYSSEIYHGNASIGFEKV